jgi:GNAT superfamily N-acetyltransferase
LSAPYRRAEITDADALAVLVNYAGEGMPEYLWTGMAEGEQTAWDVGRQRACREEGGFSYRNAVVRDEGGQAVAVLIGYPLTDVQGPATTDDLPAMFVPLQELENLAAGSWYINVLAVMPRSRGLGYGSDLLTIAGRMAKKAGRVELSIIVSDANSGARRLYERSGFVERARRPMVKDGWTNAGQSWLLLTRRI